jgi:IS5 family transposase
MHQARKGQQWYFGMKAHIGVDSQTRVNPRGGGDRAQCA